MRIIDARILQKRITEAASQMDCKNNQAGRSGKTSSEVDRAIFELMFIHKFLPFWSTEQVRQKECYLNNKYSVQ